MRRILLLGPILAGLLLIGLAYFPRFGTSPVFAKQWITNFPHGVAIGDYDNDGLNEIAIAECGTGTVTVYKSDGTTIMKQFAGLNQPWGVAIGDYNNDGLSDIAIAESGAGNVTVYKNDGTTIIWRWFGLPQPQGVAIGDYNNDGLNELAWADSGWNVVAVYKSDGATQVAAWGGLSFPVGVAIGDFNNDGLNDLAFAEATAGRVTVYKNDGTTIIKQWTGLEAPEGVAIGDYDNDGLNDLAIGELVSNVPPPTGRLTVYKSDGTTIITKLTGLDRTSGVAIGDYNNDGLNDLAFAEVGGWVTVYYQTKHGTVARVAEPTIVTLRGTLTNATGYPILSGSIRVAVKDSMGTQVWQDTFNNVIDHGRYNLPLGTKTTLTLVKGQIYSVILEVDADSPTFVSADVIYGDNNPAGDLIKFVAD